MANASFTRVDLPRSNQDPFLHRVRRDENSTEQGQGSNDRHLFELRVPNDRAKYTDRIYGADDVSDELSNCGHPGRYMHLAAILSGKKGRDLTPC